jgi:ABC-type phosphate/phosphonate transport system ATPase subunit
MSTAAQSLPIDISNLCKAYGAVKALDEVSLNIAAGEFLTLLWLVLCALTVGRSCLAIAK